MDGRIPGEWASALAEIVGRENVITDAEKMVDYGHDEFSLRDISRMPVLVVKPRSPLQVAAILKSPVEAKIPVTPRGGATGCAAAAFRRRAASSSPSSA